VARVPAQLKQAVPSVAPVRSPSWTIDMSDTLNAPPPLKLRRIAEAQ